MTEPDKGKLKIFIGYAPGVGKTYKMLEEAQALRAQGRDVVIGYFESHDRPDTIAKAAGLEVVPRKKISYEGALLEEMDAEAILARRPQICVVDEFRHTNVAASKRARRWEDVVMLLDAGIDVMTTLDIQHLESLNDEAQHIIGGVVGETVPDWLIDQADEVVLVDLTPRALLHRMERGVIYKGEEAQLALKNLFREPTLVALRELALREAAHKVEHRIASGEVALAGGGTGRELPKQERILVYLTADPKTAIVIRRAKRVSDFLGGECFAVAVQPPRSSNPSSSYNLGAVETHLNFARNLHIEARILEGEDPACLILDFARQNHITQIFVARPRARIFLSRDPVQKLIDSAKDMQIVIVSGRDPVQGQF